MTLHPVIVTSMSNILIFYDGNCPLCCAKRDFLQHRDREGVLTFSNIRSADFQPLENLPDLEVLAYEIHSIASDGRILRGMQVIREAYKLIGLGWLMAPTGWPILRPLFDRLYTHVARHRLKYSKMLHFFKR